MTLYAESGLGCAAWEAIGTRVEVLTRARCAIDQAREMLLRCLEDLDRAASRFRGDSEVTALSAAGGRPVKVSPLLRDIVVAALRVAEDTGGLVDPTVGVRMTELGYDRDLGLLPVADGRPVLSVLRRFTWRDVTVDAARRTVRVPPGLVLDLGATAKAWAVDATVNAVAAATGTGVLVNLGGDIAVAGDASETGWPVGVSADVRRPDGGPTVALRAGALATSSTAARRWHRGGHDLHHVLDPVTGWPAAGPWRAVTVHARTCLQANAAATAAVVLGDLAPTWLRRRGIAARLATGDDRVVTTPGWLEQVPA